MERNETLRRLLITSKPKPDESFTGYVLRLTELNMYDHPTLILKLAGAAGVWVERRCSFTFGKAADWARMSEITGVSADVLASVAYPPTEDRYSVVACGQLIPVYLIRIFNPKVCPACLREAGYCRKLWDMAFVTVCDTHRCLLLDECPNCQKPLTLVRSKVCVCRCEFDWREANAPAVEEPDLRIARHARRLFGLPETRGGKKWMGIGQPFAGLSLETFLTSIFFIMGQRRGVLDTKGKFTAPFRQNAEMHRLLLDTLAVFDDWPEGFFKFLDWRRAQPFKGRFRDKMVTGVNQDFGTFHHGLARTLSSPEYEFMRQAYKDYLASHWDGGISRTPMLKSVGVDSKKYVHRNEARKLLSTDFKWVLRLIETGRLKGIIRQRKRSRLILIERESLDALKRTLDEALGMTEVEALLGVSNRSVLYLIQHGCIELLRGPEVDGFAMRKFRGNVVEDLFNRIRGRIESGRHPSHQKTVTLISATIILGRCELNIGQVVRKILDGDLVPSGEGSGVGLNRFLLADEVVRDFLEAQLQGIRDGALGLREAERLMGLQKWSLPFVVRKGFIAKGSGVGKNGSQATVSQAAVDAFNAMYATGGSLARTYKTSYPGLLRLLRENGIAPVSGADVDGGSQYIFRKADLHGVDIHKLVVDLPHRQRSRANDVTPGAIAPSSNR